MVDVLSELKPMQQAFPSTVALMKGAVTYPAVFVKCERSFSKMKLIGDYARNSMAVERLRDINVLDIERDFQIDFEKVVDVFVEKYNDSRSMLS